MIILPIADALATTRPADESVLLLLSGLFGTLRSRAEERVSIMESIHGKRERLAERASVEVKWMRNDRPREVEASEGS